MQSATPIFVFIFRSLLFAESSYDLRSPVPFFIWILFFLAPRRFLMLLVLVVLVVMVLLTRVRSTRRMCSSPRLISNFRPNKLSLSFTFAKKNIERFQCTVTHLVRALPPLSRWFVRLFFRSLGGVYVYAYTFIVRVCEWVCLSVLAFHFRLARIH